MWRFQYALVSFVMFAVLACGGGTGDPAQDEPVPLADRSSAVPGPTYRAVFSVRGTEQSGDEPAKDVAGESVLYSEGAAPASPAHGLVGTSCRMDMDWLIGGIHIVQSECDYLYEDGDGYVWSLGGRFPDGTDYFWHGSNDYGLPLGVVEDRVLIYRPSLDDGAISHYSVSARTLGDELLFTQTGSIEVLPEQPTNTGVGWYDAFQVVRTREMDFPGGSHYSETSTTAYRADMNVLRQSMWRQGGGPMGAHGTTEIELVLQSLEE